jgi:hypothetical protein
MPDNFQKTHKQLQRLLREALKLTKSLPQPEGVAQETATFYDTDASRYHIDHYGDRLWALYEGEDLVVVTAYRRGARAVLGKLQSLERQLAELRQLLADQATSTPLAAPEQPDHSHAPPQRSQERVHRPAEQLPLIEKHPRYRATNRPSSGRGR